MDIKLEILSEVISEAIHEAIEYIHIDADKLVNSDSILALGEIQKILQDESITEDFDVVEKIVEIFKNIILMQVSGTILDNEYTIKKLSHPRQLFMF